MVLRTNTDDIIRHADGRGDLKMFRTRDTKVYPLHRFVQVYHKVEFPTFAHFVEDMTDMGIENVRLDVFEEVKQSELSFVYYITLTVFLTARDSIGNILYEYTEPIGTIASTDKKLQDESFMELAQGRIRELEEQLRGAKLRVRRGRYSVPNDNEG